MRTWLRNGGRAFSRAAALLCIGALLLILYPGRASGGAYLTSAHGNATTGVNRSHLDTNFSTLPKGHCGHCHEQHASIGGSEPSPVDGPDIYLLFTDWSNNFYNDLCNMCHDGTAPAPGADNILASYGRTCPAGTSACSHPTTGTHTSTESGGQLGSNRHAYCIDCHQPHTAMKPAHTAPGNDATTSPVKGTWGVEPTFSAPGVPTAGTELLSTPTYTRVEPITKEYQLCLKCHSSYAYGASPPNQITNPGVPQTDQGKEFNPFNYSHHPVTGTTWKNPTIRANYTTVLNAPWNANLDARMYCSDCHGDATTGAPAGPHGSNRKYLLKAWGHPTNANAPECYDNLCLICHVADYDGGGGSVSNWSHGSNAAHQYEGEAVGENSLGCRACHGGPDMANYSNTGCPPSGTYANGGRTGALHGENFYWNNPATNAKCTTFYPNPADHFLLGGYLTGITIDSYHGGSDGDGTCWASMTGATDGCSSMTGSKPW